MFSKLMLSSKHHNFLTCCKLLCRAGLPRNAKPYSMEKVEIVDINIDSMMYDDEYHEQQRGSETVMDPPLRSVDLCGAPIAPIDINPWIEEEDLLEGTVLEDTIERKDIISVVPEPPTHRSGIYEFKGIKIFLPKKLLNTATYRYRLDQEDEERLADDIRICKFDK